MPLKHLRLVSPAWIALAVSLGVLLASERELSARTERILMHTSQDGQTPVQLILADQATGVFGQITWQGASNRVAFCTTSHERFERLWAELMSSDAPNFRSRSRNVDGKKNYAFSIGESPGGIHTNFEVPKGKASPAVIGLDRELRAMVKTVERQTHPSFQPRARTPNLRPQPIKSRS